MRAKLVKENIGGAGGAGYAVWGGGWGRSFGNPSMGGRYFGRGFGFGGSQNLSGGPNLMYTYDVKPLTQDLQQKPSPQDNEEIIHTGCKIKGHVLNTDQEVEGNIIHIEEDEDNNIKWYVVLDDEGIKQKVDPTTAYLVKPEEFIDPFMMDLVGDESTKPQALESFYPLLFEKKKQSARDAVKRGKLPKEIKEKILKLGVSSYKNGRAKGIGKPKIKGKSFKGVGLGADKNGFFVYTHRARSKSHSDPKDIPIKDIKFIESTG